MVSQIILTIAFLVATFDWTRDRSLWQVPKMRFDVALEIMGELEAPVETISPSEGASAFTD
jgi:hypothetical protein